MEAEQIEREEERRAKREAGEEEREGEGGGGVARHRWCGGAVGGRRE
jgi:hypothetical protein